MPVLRIDCAAFSILKPFNPDCLSFSPLSGIADSADRDQFRRGSEIVRLRYSILHRNS